MARLLVAGARCLGGIETKIALEARGHQIVTCTEAQAAIALFLDDPPDLLVLEKGFDGGSDADLIRVAAACLQKTNIPILLLLEREDLAAGLDWQAWPVDDVLVHPVAAEELVARVALAQARMARVFDNNPLSKLPGNTSILNAIQRAIDDHDRAMAVCYVDIDNFKPYNDHYGFSQGDDVILMVARLLVNVMDEMARGESFVGHVGGDDFVFIVAADKAEAVCRRFLTNFEAVRNMFIEPEDVKRGGFVGKDRQGRETRFGLLSISVAVVPVGGGRFSHFGEVSAVASQLKHKVKKLEGSNFLIDRREGYCPP